MIRFKYPNEIWKIIISFLIYDYRYLDNILFNQRKYSGKFINYNKQIQWVLWWRRVCNHHRRKSLFNICNNSICNLYLENKKKISRLKRTRNSYLKIDKVESCNNLEYFNNIKCDGHCHLLCDGDCKYLCNNKCTSVCHYHCNNHPDKKYKCDKKCHKSFEVIKLICEKCLLDKNSIYKICTCKK